MGRRLRFRGGVDRSLIRNLIIDNVDGFKVAIYVYYKSSKLLINYPFFVQNYCLIYL